MARTASRRGRRRRRRAVQIWGWRRCSEISPRERTAGIKLEATHCCGSPPPTLAPTLLSTGGCACAAILFAFSHSLSPSFIPLLVIRSPPSFVHSANPTHLILISSFFYAFSLARKRKKKNGRKMSKKKKKNTHMRVCARACGWRGPVPPQGSTVSCGVMQRNAKISAVPLPNGVSMATKGAKPCDAVSTTEDFKP